MRVCTIKHRISVIPLFASIKPNSHWFHSSFICRTAPLYRHTTNNNPLVNKSLASAFMQPFLAVCTVHCGRLGYEMLEFQIQGMNCSLLLCYYFCEISMENWQTKRHLEIFGSIFTKLQIHFIIKAVGYCRYASFCCHHWWSSMYILS